MTLRSSAAKNDRVQKTEWATFALIVTCYVLWIVVLFSLSASAPVLSVLLAGLIVAFHASLEHEVLHGHPFRSKALNEALVFLPLNLFIPYNRFRDLHLAHHLDSNLTDPYDDPESNYLDPAVWSKMPGWKRALFRLNNTLFGRMLVGPLIGQTMFTIADWCAAMRGDRSVIIAWALHIPGLAIVIGLVLVSPMPLWAYVISAYIGLSILKIRTFLEHRAHEKTRARTVIIEDRGPLLYGYLKVNDSCAECQEELFHHRADDGPAYLTILIVGHILAPLLLYVFVHYRPEPFTLFAVFAIGCVSLSLYLLPRLKGAMIGFQWARYMHGFGQKT